MALKAYNYLNHWTRYSRVQSTSSKKKQLIPGRALGRLLARKPDDSRTAIEEERSPTSDKSARKNVSEERDCETKVSFDNYPVDAMFKHIDELVGNLVVNRSPLNNTGRTCTEIKPTDDASMTSNEETTSYPRLQPIEMKITYAAPSKELIGSVVKVQQDDAANNYFHCFNCGELFENFFVEHIEIPDDESGISALTDNSTSLDDDLVFLRSINAIYADNSCRKKSRQRRTLDVAIRDDQTYLEFDTEESRDSIAVESLVRDDMLQY